MRRFLALCALLLAVPGAALADPAGLDLAKYRGKVVYVDFWASWCGPCKQAFPFMAELARGYRPADVVIVTVNEERSRAAGEAFLHQVGSNLPVVWDADGAVARPYGVNELPVTLIFDRKGHLRQRHQGFVAGDAARNRREISALVAEH